MAKAYWKNYEILEIDYRDHSGWVEVILKMNGFESPLTGTGRVRVLMDDIEIRDI